MCSVLGPILLDFFVLSWFDRILGGVFGLLRGLTINAVFIFGVVSFAPFASLRKATQWLSLCSIRVKRCQPGRRSWPVNLWRRISLLILREFALCGITTLPNPRLMSSGSVCTLLRENFRNHSCRKLIGQSLVEAMSWKGEVAGMHTK